MIEHARLAFLLIALLLGQSALAQEASPPPADLAPLTSDSLNSEVGEEPPLRFTAWPLFYRERRPGYSETSILNYSSLETEDRSEVHLFPILSFEREGETSSSAVRPFYWSHEDTSTETGYQHLLPLWVSWWDADSTTMITLPGAVYARRGDRHMFHLWPLFGTHDLEGGGSRVFGPAHGFWLDLDQTQGSGGFAAPFPLVFANWTPEEATTVAAPLLFFRRRSGDSSWWLSAPFAFSSQGPDSERLWTIPYAYTRDAEETRHDVLFPLFTRADSHDGTRSETSLRPLFWHERTPERTWSMTLPLYYYESGEERQRFYTLLYQRDETPERTWSLSAPFFYSYSSEEESRLWTIPYAYTRDAEQTRHDVLFPFFTRAESHDGTSSETALRPLFWHERTPERTWSLGLPFYYYESSEKQSRFYTPLYQWDQTPERTESLSFPFFYSYSSEEESRLWTIPYAYTRDAKQTRHDVLFPFFTRAESHDGTRSETALRPLFWHERTPEREWSLGLPFYYYEATPDTGRLYTPLFQLDETRDAFSALSLPFFYSYQSEEESRFWTIPYAYTRDAEQTRHDVLFPFFTRAESHDGKSSQTALRPLFWHERTPEREWSLGLPFYYYEATPNTGRLYTPLFQLDESRDAFSALSLPFFYSYQSEEESRFWTIPYAYTRDAEQTRHDVLFPLFTHAESHDGTRSETAFRPLFWYESTPERTWSLGAPLYYYESSAERSRLYTPLYQWDQTPERTWALSFPFFYSYQSEEESSFYTLPYTYSRDTEESRHDVLFPLFTHAASHDGTRSDTALRPLFWHERTPEETWSLGVPFYYYESSKEVGRLYTPLFQFEETQDESSLLSLPFFYSYQSEEESRLWTIPYAYTRDAEQTRHDVLFPFFTHAESHDERSSLTALRPLFWHERTPEETWSLGVPFYYYESSKEVGRLYTPLFQYEETQDESSLLSIPFVYSYQSEEESRLWTIPYAYTRDAEQTRHDVLFPFFTRAESHDEKSSLTALRPLFWHERTPEREWSFALPFYYYEATSDEGSLYTPLFQLEETSDAFSALSFPFFYSHQSEEESRFWTIPYAYTRDAEQTRHDVLFPFFTRAESHDGTRSETALRPLFWYDKTPERTWSLTPLYYGRWSEERDLFISPLYLHSRNEETDFELSAFLPLYWQVRSGETKVRTAFPLYWEIENESQREHSFHVWPFYSRSSEGDYTQSSFLWPLMAYGSGGGRSHARFLPLFLYDETEASEESEAGWRFDLLYPLLHLGGGEERAEFSLLGGLSNYDAEGEDYDFRVLGWWYRNRRDSERRQHYWLPFFYSSAESEESQFWFLYPLFEYERSGETGQVDVLWKTFTYDWNAEGSEWRFLHKFVHSRREGRNGLFEINPFFSYEWEGDERGMFQILGGLYYRRKLAGEWKSGGFWGLL